MVRQLALGTTLIFLLCGCAGSGGGQVEEAPPSSSLLADGTRVAHVRVIEGTGFDDEQRKVIADYQALERLESEVVLALQKQSGYDASGTLSVDVVLDGFRLRSNAASLWLGSMAGADSVAASVSVRRGDDVLKSFRTDTSSIMGGIAYTGRTVRLNRLVVELAKRITAGL